ncbi:hypothetical protein BJX70DRAFT_401396 [Aspergillus crustosus]
MSSMASTAQIAAAVLKGCTNAIHAAYVYRKMVNDAMLQQVLNDVRDLASLVSSTSAFWTLDPELPVSPEMITVGEALKPVLRECAGTLQRLETLLATSVSDIMEGTGFGAKAIDLGLYGWKINSFADGVGLVLSMAKTDDRPLGLIDFEHYKEQSRWFQMSIEQIEDRGKTGEVLVEEIFTICDNIRHLEDLATAVTGYATARGRRVIVPKVAEPTERGCRYSKRVKKELDMVAAGVGLPGSQPNGQVSSAVAAQDVQQMTSEIQSIKAACVLEEIPEHDEDAEAGVSLDTAASDASTMVYPGLSSSVNAGLVIDQQVPETPVVLESQPPQPMKAESEEIAQIKELIKDNDYPTADKVLDSLLSRMAIGAVSSKLALAEYFYNMGKFDRVVSLLQIPLIALQNEPTAAGRVDYLMAKTYFARGNLSRAVDYCTVGIKRTKKEFGIYHPAYLQFLELQVQIFRANDRPGKGAEVRFDQFLPSQSDFLDHIDNFEIAFKKDDKHEALKIMTALVEDLKPKTSTVTMPTHSTFIDRLGPCEEWEYHTTVLGFHNDHSLLTILADLDDMDRVMLLCIRGNATIELPAGRSRSALDLLLRSAALAGQSGRIETLLDVGADIEADHDHMLWWRSVGEEYAGLTPLHIAVKAAHIDVVKVLVKRGANIEAKTGGGKTALMIADEGSQPDIFTFLLEKGARVE